MADEMDRKLSQGVIGELGDEVSLHENGSYQGSDLIGAIGVVGQLAPVQFHDDFTRVRGLRHTARQSPPGRNVDVVGKGEVDFVAREIGARETKIARDAIGHRNHPIIDIAVEAVSNNRQTGSGSPSRRQKNADSKEQSGEFA